MPRSDSNQSQEILWCVGDEGEDPREGQDTLWDVGDEGEAQGSRFKLRFLFQVQGNEEVMNASCWKLVTFARHLREVARLRSHH